MVGQKLLIVRNAWREDGAQAVCVGDDGHEVYHVLHVKQRNELGFLDGAVVIGERYKRHADTPAQQAVKEIELLATGAATQAGAADIRKQRKLAFGGRIDPFKLMDEAQLPAYLPRHGRALDLPNPVTVPVTVLDATTAMLRVVDAIGRHLTPEEHAFMKARYAEGVPEDQLNALIAQFAAPAPEAQRPAAGGLRAA